MAVLKMPICLVVLNDSPRAATTTRARVRSSFTQRSSCWLSWNCELLVLLYLWALWELQVLQALLYLKAYRLVPACQLCPKKLQLLALALASGSQTTTPQPQSAPISPAASRWGPAFRSCAKTQEWRVSIPRCAVRPGQSRLSSRTCLRRTSAALCCWQSFPSQTAADPAASGISSLCKNSPWRYWQRCAGAFRGWHRWLRWPC